MPHRYVKSFTWLLFSTSEYYDSINNFCFAKFLFKTYLRLQKLYKEEPS